MKVSTFTDVRQNFAATMQKVIDDNQPMIITRQNKEPVVMMSLHDFNAYEETAYLMRSPANAERLNSAIASLEVGEGKNRELIEE